MNTYNNILKGLQLSKKLEKLIHGDISIPVLDDFKNVNKYWYPHPPCLIPLFLGYGASYKGIVHHFFSRRKNTFIEYNLENGFFSEIARNENQLFTILILRMIVIQDDISDDILSFSKSIDYAELNQIDEFSIKHGDDLSYYKDLIYYNQNTPFKYIKNIDEYNGDFPSSLSVVDMNKLPKSCSFEISKKDVLLNIETPLWMKNDIDKKSLFENFVANNQLEEAWYTVNSTGWKLDQIAESLRVLKKKHNDEFLHLVVDNWINNWEKSDFTDKTYTL